MKLRMPWGLWAIAAALQCRAAEAVLTDNNALWRPRFATPAIVALDTATNRQFTAEVRASAAAQGWSLTLSNDLKAWPCQVISVTHATINRGTEPGWHIKASIPSDISPELFTLVVSSSEAVSVQSQAVSVTSSFTNDFYILHIADEQIVNQTHTDPSGQYYGMVGSWDEMKWMQEPVNLINPRFVLITGDQIDYNGALDGWNNWVNWGYQPPKQKHFSREETLAIQNRLVELYKDSHKGYRVPYALTPGNHDVPPVGKLLKGSTIEWHSIGAPLYETQFGQRTWSFRMGGFYVLLHDWSERSLKQWAASDYQAAINDPSIEYRLIGQHFNTDQAFVPETCDLMLVGHGHTGTTVQTSPYYIYEDGPAFKYGTTGFFNFRRTPTGWRCDQTASPRNPTKDIWRLFTDHGALNKLRSNCSDALNITANSVTITNDLPQQFYDGRVRFVLDKGIYTASHGTVLAQYDCHGGSKTAVVVRVCIPAHGTLTVNVAAGNTALKALTAPETRTLN